MKLMSVSSSLVLMDSLTLYNIWSYAQQTKRTHRNMPNAPLMKVCPKQCSLFVIKSKIRETYSQQTLIQILSNDQNKWIPKMICDNNICTFYAVGGTIWGKCLNALSRYLIKSDTSTSQTEYSQRSNIQSQWHINTLLQLLFVFYYLMSTYKLCNRDKHFQRNIQIQCR